MSPRGQLIGYGMDGRPMFARAHDEVPFICPECCIERWSAWDILWHGWLEHGRKETGYYRRLWIQEHGGRPPSQLAFWGFRRI